MVVHSIISWATTSNNAAIYWSMKRWSDPVVLETQLCTLWKDTLHSGLIPGGKRPGRVIPANGAWPWRGKGTSLGACGESTQLERANMMLHAAVSNKDDTNRVLLPFFNTKFNLSFNFFFLFLCYSWNQCLLQVGDCKRGHGPFIWTGLSMMLVASHYSITS